MKYKKIQKYAIIICLIFCALISLGYCDCQGMTEYLKEMAQIIKQWQTLAAAILAVIGWFVNGYLVRRSEVAKRRLELRIHALKDVIENILFEISKGADKALKNPDFKEKLEKARATMQMYGFNNEIKIYEGFIAALNMKQDTLSEQNEKLLAINRSIPTLIKILHSLRSEIGLDKYEPI